MAHNYDAGFDSPQWPNRLLGDRRRGNAQIFREYIRQVLGPTLQPGDLVICDNLSAHYDQAARELMEDRGAQLLILPAYSPDLNPIEMMWAKVKQQLRSARSRSQRTCSQLSVTLLLLSYLMMSPASFVMPGRCVS